MNPLGRKYSDKIERLWSTLDPKPELGEYPENELYGKNPRFAGKYQHAPDTGDVVSVVLSVGSEYTLAHELMHAVLRREGYPHFCFRELGLEFEFVCHIAQYLEGFILHPVLNRRLANIGFEIPSDYTKELVSNEVAAQASRRTGLLEHPQYFLPILSLFFAEMTMWDMFPESELRSQLAFPEVWELTTEILRGTQGIASASPNACLDMAVDTVKTIDNFLVRSHRLEKDLYFNRILFPPPPFDGNSAESPANEVFGVQLRDLGREWWELEIFRLSNGSFCWSDGPLGSDTVQDRLIRVRTKLQSLSGKDFADFCERFLTTAV